jgi:kinesin family member 15
MKMMLRFREEMIHRMKSLVDGLMPMDSYLVEENNALIEESQLLRARVDWNPEVSRFALENIRLLDQLSRLTS